MHMKNSVGIVGNETVSFRKILELVWVSVNDEELWDEYLLKEQFYPSMKRIKDSIISRL